jgi:hypothetical protein
MMRTNKTKLLMNLTRPNKNAYVNEKNVVNNIMNITYGGANINIRTQPNTQNNFIFNTSAPINFNVYKTYIKNNIKNKNPYHETTTTT